MTGESYAAFFTSLFNTDQFFSVFRLFFAIQHTIFLVLSFFQCVSSIFFAIQPTIFWVLINIISILDFFCFPSL